MLKHSKDYVEKPQRPKVLCIVKGCGGGIPDSRADVRELTDLIRSRYFQPIVKNHIEKHGSGLAPFKQIWRSLDSSLYDTYEADGEDWEAEDWQAETLVHFLKHVEEKTHPFEDHLHGNALRRKILAERLVFIWRGCVYELRPERQFRVECGWRASLRRA